MTKKLFKKYLPLYLIIILFLSAGFYFQIRQKNNFIQEAKADTIQSNDFVSKIRSSSGDYTSLSEWETAIQSDLTSASSKIFTVSSVGTYNATQDDGKTVAFSGGGTGTLKHINTENKAYIIDVSGTVNSGAVTVNGHSFTISDTGVQIGRAIAECYNDWSSGMEADLEIKDWTADANHYIKIYAPVGQRHNAIAYDSGFFIKETSGWDAGIDIYVPYTDIEYIGFYPSNQGSIGVLLRTNYIKIDSCLFKDDNKSYAAKAIDCSVRNNFTISNCIAQGLDIGFSASGYNTSGKILNSVATGCNIGFKQIANGARTKLSNNVALNNSTSNWDAVANWDGGSSNNASDDSVADNIPGANSVVNVLATDFLNYAGSNFHLSPTSKLKDKGTSFTSIFTGDIDGETRSGTWDIGADEITGGALIVDTEVPSIPLNLSSSNLSSSQVTLNWNASTDNIGVSGYEIYRNSALVNTSFNNSYTDTGLSPSTAYSYQVLAYDAAGNKSNKSSSISITTNEVSLTNSAPVLASIGDKNVSEGTLLSFSISATDSDGDTLTYSAQGLPTGATFNSSTKTFSWTPSVGQAGTYNNIIFTVSDGKESDTENITITVNQKTTETNVEKILDNGDSATHIDLAIIGSGFTAAELATYKTKVDQNVAKTFTVNWFNDNKNLFNIWRIDAESPESGKDITDTEIYSLASKVSYDVLIVLHNYDGQESVAKSYIEIFKFSNSYVVLAHELGHKIGRLDDEYWTPAMAYKCDGLSKRTLNTHDRASNEKWVDLISTAPYEGGRYCENGIWRPSEDSIMRNSANSTYFDAVGLKAMDLGAGKILGTTESNAPSLAISGLNDNETKKGSFTAQAVTSDVSGIERVEFYWAKAGDTSKSIKIDRTSPYDITVDTTKYADGQYYLDTLSYDKNWNYSRVTRIFNIKNSTVSAGLNVPIIVSEALTQDSDHCWDTFNVSTSACDRTTMAGLNRVSEPVTVGIPLAEDAGIKNISQLGINGATFSQFRPLAYWDNGNIKWVLVDTQVSVNANGSNTIYLTSGSGNTTGSNLATDNGDYININTGAAQFKIRKKNFNFIDQVVVGGKTLVFSGNSGGLSLEGYEDTTYTLKKDGTVHTLKSNEIYKSNNDDNSTAIIEENGPVKTIIKATGSFKDSQGNRFMDYTVRFYFYKNKEYVKPIVILRHGQEEIHPNDYAGYYSQMPRVFSNAQVNVPLNLGGTKNFTFALKDENVTGIVDNSAYIFQGHSVAHESAVIERDKQDGSKGWFYPPMQRVDETVKNTNYIQQGVEIKNGSAVLNPLGNEKEWTKNWAEIKDQDNTGLSVSMQYMNRYWPSSIEFNNSGNTEIGIFSKYNSKKDIKMGWGTHETRNMMLDFHTSSIDNKSVVYRLEQPLAGKTTLEQYRTTKVIFGQEGLVSAEEMDSWWDDNFGSHLNYNNPKEAWKHTNMGNAAWRVYWYSGVEGTDWPLGYSLGFLQNGVGGRYMSAFQKTIFNTDSAILRTDGFDYAESKVRTDYRYPIIETGTYNSTNHFDLSHNHWRAMPLYYYMTGDEEIKEAINDYMEEFIKKGAVAHPSLKLDMRAYSRYYSTLALGYEFNKDEKLKTILETMTDDVLDSRDNPPELEPKGRNMERGYFWQDFNYFKEPTVHSFFLYCIFVQDFWQGMRIFQAYDPVYARTEEMRDILLGIGQFMYNEAYFVNTEENDFGYTYNYLLHKTNYWPDPALADYTQNSDYIRKDDSSRIMLLSYIQTGDEKYLERGKKLLAYGAGESSSTPYPAQDLIYADLHGVPGVWQYVNSVQATNTGSNKYTLSWKVPDGATEYQIKFSDKEIVDWLGFNQTTREYQYSPDNYTAFFAAWNINNEPTPLAGGATQIFTMDTPQVIAAYNSSRSLAADNPSYITYDPAKTYHFSVKYYSASGAVLNEDSAPSRTNGAPSGELNAGTIETNISLITNETAVCRYSTAPNVDYNSMSNVFTTTGGMSHSSVVKNLTNGSSYKYYVKCIGGSGHANADDYIIQFTVAEAGQDDKTAPTGSVAIKDGLTLTNNPVVNLTLSANDSSGVAQMKVSENNNIAQVAAESFNAAKAFVVSLTNGLKTIYVWFKDKVGNWNNTPYSTTITLDTTSPDIDNVETKNITETGVKINWLNNEDSCTQLEYGLTNMYGEKTVLETVCSKNHSVDLEDLSENTTYHFRIIAKDKAGNISQSIDYELKTLEGEKGADTVPPAKIEDLSMQNITQTSLELLWTATGDDGAEGTASTYDIRYFKGNLTEGNWENATQVAGEPVPSKTGTEEEPYVIVGLLPDTAYSFAIKARDEAGNWSDLSNVVEIKTKAAPATGTTEDGGSSGGGSTGGSTNVNTGGSTTAGGEFSDTTPPAQPSRFKALPAEKQIFLTWINPKDADFTRVKILRKIDSAPVSASDKDAQLIYEGDKQEYTDINLINGKTYYYSIFAYDKKPNYSKALTISAIPVEGQNTVSTPNNNIENRYQGIKNLYGLSSEIVELISQEESEVIFSHNSFVDLTDINKVNYTKIVGDYTGEVKLNNMYSIAKFIQEGTETTERLGSGERAGVLNSYRSVFGRLPESNGDWQDVIKIANGRWPNERNEEKENQVQNEIFNKIYNRVADMNNANDNAAVTIMVYGLRPVNRNLESEKAGIRIFRAIYKYDPTSATDWDIVRAVAYSGSSR